MFISLSLLSCSFRSVARLLSQVWANRLIDWLIDWTEWLTDWLIGKIRWCIVYNILTFDCDADLTHGRRWNSVAGDTLVQIVRVARHVPNHHRFTRFVRYTCHQHVHVISSSGPLVTGTTTQGRPKKRWIGKNKEGIQKRRSNIRQATDCFKDRKQEQTFIRTAPSSATYGWRRTGQKKSE